MTSGEGRDDRCEGVEFPDDVVADPPSLSTLNCMFGNLVNGANEEIGHRCCMVGAKPLGGIADRCQGCAPVVGDLNHLDQRVQLQLLEPMETTVSNCSTWVVSQSGSHFTVCRWPSLRVRPKPWKPTMSA